MGIRRGSARLLALTAIVSIPILGLAAGATARPALHHATRSTPDDSTTWVGTEAPIPADAWPPEQQVWLSASACPGAGSCVAVGYYNDTENNSQGLIDTISNGTSSYIQAPDPPHGHDAVLSGVTCSSTAFCVAIGHYGNSDLGVIETLSGGSWTGTEAPVPSDVPNGSGVTLGAVACPADGSCVVVGQANSLNPDLETIPFIDTLSDGTWTAIDAPLPADALADFEYNGPMSIACPAVGSCVATGRYQSDPTDTVGLIDTLSGGTWTAQAAPSPPSTAANQNTGLGSVACPAVSSCEAIGGDSTSAGVGDDVIETLSAGSWNVAEAPLPADSSSDYAGLSDIACPAVGSCEIVGSYGPMNGEGGHAFTEDQSGDTWTPTVQSGDVSGLNSVACPAVGSCIAVGQGQGPGAVPVVATLSGGVWTMAGVPTPANAGVEPSLGQLSLDFPDAGLVTVSCATVDSCLALGHYGIPNPSPYPATQEALVEALGLGGPLTPVISSADQATFTVGQSGSFRVTASGAPVISEKGKLPKGLHFGSGPGTATISGKPSKKTGSYALTITATSKSTNERISQVLRLTVQS
jgi:hypothetical protein